MKGVYRVILFALFLIVAPYGFAQDLLWIEVGEVHDLAAIILNNKDLGEVWTSPWQLDITDALINGENHLEIRVANRWPNRMIGDEFKPYDGVSDGELPTWITGGEKRSSGRYTFTTLSCYTGDSPLLPSGLFGPVTLKQKNKQIRIL